MLFTPLVLALAQAAAPAPAASPLPDLTLEQANALRCSVAFGLVHQAQRAGNGSASDYPVMAQRGQEFFVRTTARLMKPARTRNGHGARHARACSAGRDPRPGG